MSETLIKLDPGRLPFTTPGTVWTPCTVTPMPVWTEVTLTIILSVEVPRSEYVSKSPTLTVSKNLGLALSTFPAELTVATPTLNVFVWTTSPQKVLKPTNPSSVP